ncbi:MAG: Carbon monoxide dehydrogenase medium chain [Anaerolineales bacterium]|nr:Carbon monoxide dehydrogenase medium chain [Anaerolineales bacterium]
MLWKDYYSPTTLDEVLDLLEQHAGQARIMAGGTDLVIELERGLRQAPTVIDVTRIPDLDAVTLDDDGLIHLGPLVTHNHLVDSNIIIERAFPLAQAAWSVGGPQIRNRGTVAGNVITASPANDTITPLMALDASVTLASKQSRRTVAFEDFFLGVRQPALADGEMLIDIAFPAMRETERGCFIKLGLRRAQAISVLNVAVVLDFNGDTVTRARVAMGSVAPTVIRAPQAERVLVGSVLDDDAIDETARLASRAARPIDDLRGTAEYRREMVRRLTRRALRQLRDATERAGWPQKRAMLWGPNGPQPSRLAASAVHQNNGQQPIETVVNGKRVTIRNANGKTLLDALREDAGLTGTKEGCAEGECGACTVWLDGVAVDACLVPAPRAHGAEVVTIEGLAASENPTVDDVHPVQRAFILEGGVQCGYCTPGLIMAGAALLRENTSPTMGEIKQSITGNLCRCTGYYKVLSAIERAAADLS